MRTKHFNWNDKLIIEFARISQGGSYGEYKGCKSLESKLERFKELNQASSNIIGQIRRLKWRLEELKFGSVKYPQFNILPNGTYHVKQRGGKGYVSFLANGKMICISHKINNKNIMKRYALHELNNQLRQVALIWNTPTIEQFEEVIL